MFNPFPSCGDFRRLLIIFANSWDPDQAQHFKPDKMTNVGPDLYSVRKSNGIPVRISKKIL